MIEPLLCWVSLFKWYVAAKYWPGAILIILSTFFETLTSGIIIKAADSTIMLIILIKWKTNRKKSSRRFKLSRLYSSNSNWGSGNRSRLNEEGKSKCKDKRRTIRTMSSLSMNRLVKRKRRNKTMTITMRRRSSSILLSLRCLMVLSILAPSLRTGRLYGY